MERRKENLPYFVKEPGFKFNDKDKKEEEETKRVFLPNGPEIP